MSANDREALAQAYETGDAKAVGQLLGAQWADMPFYGGGVVGTVGKIADIAPTGKVDVSPRVDLAPGKSPVDMKHVIGADYNHATKKVTGGHSLLMGDVRVIEIKGKPDANGVYEATVQLRRPDGVWVDKVNQQGKLMKNTMFPVDWNEKRIKVEIDSAWKNRKSDPSDQNKWIGTSVSGVKMSGHLSPRITAYPLHIGRKK
jgi:hypothetical protein